MLDVGPPVGVLVGRPDAWHGRRQLPHDLGVHGRQEVHRPDLRHEVAAGVRGDGDPPLDRRRAGAADHVLDLDVGPANSVPAALHDDVVARVASGVVDVLHVVRVGRIGRLLSVDRRPHRLHLRQGPERLRRARRRPTAHPRPPPAPAPPDPRRWSSTSTVACERRAFREHPPCVVGGDRCDDVAIRLLPCADELVTPIAAAPRMSERRSGGRALGHPESLPRVPDASVWQPAVGCARDVLVAARAPRCRCPRPRFPLASSRTGLSTKQMVTTASDVASHR